MSDMPTTLGRYEILERVGRGNMGIVYRGRDTVLDREVAIKVMSGDFAAEDGHRARFFREARAAARLQHRNIITVFEFAEHEGTPCLVMEFLRGCSLAARLKNGPPLDLVLKLDIVTQLCAGLEFAHREGVIHRDVKPANIWLCEDGTVKLLDFGIAKSVTAAMTRSGEVLGSPYYMSPEQIGGRDLDGRADVFSAGVVLYELLAARKPFEADSPTAVMMKIVREMPPPLRDYAPDLPQALLACVARALEKDPARRYSQAADFAADLRLVRLGLEAGEPDPGVALAETLAETLPEDLLIRSDVRGHGAERPGVKGEDAADAAILHVGSALGDDAQPARRSRLPWIGVAVTLVVVGALAGVVALRRSDLVRIPAVAPLVAPQRTPDTGPAPTSGTQAAAKVAPTVLRITSEPTGAAVWVDGHDTQQVTPFDLPIRPDTPPARVRLAKRGFKTLERALTSDALQGDTLSLSLEPAEPSPTVVDLSGPYAFEVVEGGRVVSEASASHRLTLSGRRTLRMRAAEYFLDRAVVVDPARGRTISVEAPALGRLTIRTSLETCPVEIDGRAAGYPPIVDLPIASGRHTVRLTCPSGAGRQSTVSVLAGQAAVEIIR